MNGYGRTLIKLSWQSLPIPGCNLSSVSRLGVDQVSQFCLPQSSNSPKSITPSISGPIPILGCTLLNLPVFLPNSPTFCQEFSRDPHTNIWEPLWFSFLFSTVLLWKFQPFQLSQILCSTVRLPCSTEDTVLRQKARAIMELSPWIARSQICCSKPGRVASYILTSFMVFYGKKASPEPVTPQKPEAKSHSQ